MSDDVSKRIANDAQPSPLEVLRERLHRVARGRPFISIGDAAEVLGWSRAATYRAVNSGRLPAVNTTGRVRRISTVQLEGFIVGK